jgi:hypothetical protein
MSLGGTLVRDCNFWSKPPIWPKIAVTPLYQFGTGFTSILHATTVPRFAGLLRNVLCGRPALILRRQGRF